jgi:hypothetical protein
MESVAPFSLSIPKYKEVLEGNKSVVYYIVEISKKGNEKWSMEKRFREFDDLNVALKKVYGNLPLLPQKTLFSLKETGDKEKRRADLEKYLQTLILRTDTLSSEPLKRFLQVENFAPEVTMTPPKLLGDINNLVLGVRDFYYQAEPGILFTAISDMSVTSRVDSYLTNMKMPWEKEVPPGTTVTVGAVECYLLNGKLEDVKFEKMWTKTFQTQVINMYWDHTTSNLIVGKDDGSVTVLKVSAELNYLKYDEILTNKLHQGRIMGLCLESISEYIYTASEDKRLKVFDLKNNNVVTDIACGSSMLTELLYDKENKRIFISNRGGQVFIYDISSKLPSLIYTVQAHPKGIIRSIFFDPVKNYLVSSNYDDGVIALIDLQKPGKEKYAHNIASLTGKLKVRHIVWSSNRSEIYSGAEDGTVAFMDAKKAAPIYALKAHNDGITKLQLLDKDSILITGGKDRQIKFYKLPAEWRDSRLEAELVKDAKIQKQTEAMVQAKRLQEKRQEDSDEDDLNGWAKGL